MNEDISKLIGELTRLVDALSDRAGIDNSNQGDALPDYTQTRTSPYDKKEQKVISGNSQLTQVEKTRWTHIFKIFGKTYLDMLGDRKPDFDFRNKTDKTSKVINTDVTAPEEKKSFWSKLGAAVIGVIGLLAGLGLAVAAFFKGPGAMGKLMQMIGSGLIKLSSWILRSIVDNLSKWGKGLLHGLKSGPLAKAIANIKAGKFGKIFSKIAQGAGKFLVRSLRFLPGIGALVSFWFAYKNFQAGDYIGGIGELASGILDLATLIPGLGFITGPLGIALDIALLARYATMSEEKRVEQSEKLGPMFEKIKEWVADKWSKYADKLPVIGTFIHMYRAFMHAQSGNMGEAIDSLLQSMFPYIPDVAGKINKGWGFFKSLFGTREQRAQTLARAGEFVFNAKEWITNKLSKLPFFLRKPLEWFNIIEKSDDGNAPMQLTESARNVIQNVKNFFSPLEGISERIREAIPSFSSIKEGITNHFNTFKSNISVLADKVGENWNVINTVAAEKILTAKNKLKEIARDIGERAINIGEGLKTSIFRISDRIFNIGKDLLSKILKLPDLILPKIHELINQIGRIIPVDLIQNISNAGIEFGESLKASIGNIELEVNDGIMISLAESSLDRSNRILIANEQQVKLLKQIKTILVSSSRPQEVEQGPTFGGVPGMRSGSSGFGGQVKSDSLFFNDINNSATAISDI